VSVTVDRRLDPSPGPYDVFRLLLVRGTAQVGVKGLLGMIVSSSWEGDSRIGTEDGFVGQFGAGDYFLPATSFGDNGSL
jgi:hypothetical protein